MKKLKQSLLILFAFCMLIVPGIKSEAATLLKNGTTTFSDEGDIDFTMPSKGIVTISVTIKRTDNNVFQRNQKLSLILAETEPYFDGFGYYLYDKEYELERDPILLPDGETKYDNIYYYELLLDAGDYRYKLKNNGKYSGSYKVSYTIKKYPKLSTSYQISKSAIQLKTGQANKFSIKGNPSGTYPGIKEVKSTNPSVAYVRWINNTDYTYTYEVTANKSGTCKIAIKGFGTKTTKYITVKVTNPTTPKLKYQSLYFYKGQGEKNQLLYTKSNVKWSSSNRSVATVDSNGKIVAKNVGTCKITARTNGKNYVCKVTVQYRNPNFGAILHSYYSRGKQFTVKFKNNGQKDLTILSSNASALHCDYTSLDCKLKVSQTTIRPGQTRYIKFTAYKQPWYEWEDYTISYYFMYDGKKYNGHVWNDDSSFKDNGKWWCTYWRTFEDWYNDWKYS